MLNFTQLLQAYLIATNSGLLIHNKPETNNQTDIKAILGENESCLVNVDNRGNLKEIAKMNCLGKLTLEEHYQFESSCDSC